MRANFDAALAAVLLHEGGFVHHKRDPGGATCRGVTQGTYDAWRADHQLPLRTVRLITPAEIMAVYRKRYWNAVAGDQLPSGLDYCLFDFAVNSGPGRAARYLQQAIEVVADGQIGPATLAAIKSAPDAINDVCDRRLVFLKRQPTFDAFGKGWTRRVADVRAKSLAMA